MAQDRTAAEVYETEHTKAEALLAHLDAALASHAFAFAGEPRDWGYVGDLQRINEALRDVLRGMGEEPSA